MNTEKLFVHLQLADPDTNHDSIHIPIELSPQEEIESKWSFSIGIMHRITSPDSVKHGVRAVAETVQIGKSDAKLLLCDLGGKGVFVNGHQPPLVSVLSEGDELRLENESPRRVHIVRSSPFTCAEKIGATGQICPVCLGGIEAADQIFQCACGKLYHSNPKVSSRLQCALTLAHCLACEREIPLPPQSLLHHQE